MSQRHSLGHAGVQTLGDWRVVGAAEPMDRMVDGRSLWTALVATGMDRFEAIEQVRPHDPQVVPQLWLEALRLVEIPKGTFTIGSPKNEQGRDENEGPVHKVTISREFSMCALPMTQGAWQALMGSNPSAFQGNPALPVEQVSWDDICGPDGFLERLNAATAGARPEGLVFRLPSEAEWEYACRAGTSTAYSFGNDPKDLPEHGWFNGNAESMTHPVGLKTPNPWGLYDLHGNVWEWCLDGFGDYPKQAQTDPMAKDQGRGRVLRGGSWVSDPGRCRSACRGGGGPGSRGSSVGVRAVLGLPART